MLFRQGHIQCVADALSRLAGDMGKADRGDQMKAILDSPDYEETEPDVELPVDAMAL